MKTLACTIIILVIQIPAFANEPRWEIAFGWSSGWGISSTYLLNANGELTLESRWPDPEFTCEANIEKKDAIEIEELRSSVPESYAPNTLTKFLDNCHDEREGYVTLKESGVRRSFSYSLGAQCRITEPPSWLILLYERLEMLKPLVAECVEVHQKK